MGSTSEAYENGTNVVVYVANEHARLQAQQLQHQNPSAQLQLQPSLQLQPPAQLQFAQQPAQQYHRYHGSAQIVTTSAAHSSDDSEPPSPSVYKAHPYVAGAAPTTSVNATAPVVYEVADAAKGGAFFDAASHEDGASHHGCSMNGAAPGYEGAMACDNGSNASAAFAYRGSAQAGATGSQPTTLYANDKLAESNASGAHFVASAPLVAGAVPEATAPFAPPRSESARSVDSVNSVSSTLSCSSNAPTPSPTAAGGKHLSTENFANPAGCAADGAPAANFPNAAAKPNVAFSGSATAPYRLVSVPFKDIGANNAAAAAAAATAAAFQKPAVSVPLGWKRILNNGSVIYIR